jgi:hypothetical protein
MAKSTALKTYEPPKSKKQIELEECEDIIREAESGMYEGWCDIAKELLKIKSRSLYSDDFPSWKDYCASDRCDYGLRHADQIIASMKRRRLIPETGSMDLVWTERNVRPLKALSTDQSVKSCAKAIIAHCEETGERLTAKLVQRFVAKAKDTPREKRAREKKAEEIRRNTTPAMSLKKLLSYTNKHTVFLQTMDENFWLDAEAERPGIVDRVATAVEELASLLRS